LSTATLCDGVGAALLRERGAVFGYFYFENAQRWPLPRAFAMKICEAKQTHAWID